MRPSLIFAAILLPAAACSDAASPASSAAGKPSAYALAAEPAGAVPVVDARKAAPKDSAVVVGRVKEIAPGLASFTLVDASLEYCGQADGKEAGKEMACDEPWDYCCHPADEIAKYLVAVTVKDAKGDPVAGRLPELRNLDLVVVKGRLVKDKAGNVEVEAVGWYRKERPTLPAGTKFPQWRRTGARRGQRTPRSPGGSRRARSRRSGRARPTAREGPGGRPRRSARRGSRPRRRARAGRGAVAPRGRALGRSRRGRSFPGASPRGRGLRA